MLLSTASNKVRETEKRAMFDSMLSRRTDDEKKGKRNLVKNKLK